MADPVQITDMVAAMLLGFGREASEPQLLAYCLAMEDVSDADASAAIRAAIKSTSNHPPTPGQLRESAIAGGSVSVAVARAWECYVRAQATGAEYGVDFEDGAINATVRRCGGWSRCCSIPESEFHVWHKREWQEHYRRIIAGEYGPDELRPLESRLPADYHGERVKSIGVPYRAALPSPGQSDEPARIGVELKRIQ